MTTHVLTILVSFVHAEMNFLRILSVYGAEIKVEEILSVDFVFCKMLVRNRS